MRARLIQIGNSKGVRLPKTLRDEVRLGNDLELTVRGNAIVVSNRRADPRAGWEDAFRRAGSADDDEIFFPEPFDNEFDRTKWTWPGFSDASTSISSRSTRRSARKSKKLGPA